MATASGSATGCMYCYTSKYFWMEKDMVGHGSFGQVHKGRNRETGEFVAVKSCEKSDDPQHEREISLLKRLHSPYIVKFIEAQRLEDGSGRMAIIMELGEGSVRELLIKPENYFGLPYEILLRLISHLERGLSYLNENMVAHRDVKPANILIYNSQTNLTFKLCDFGGSRLVDSATQPLYSICGTPGYLNEFITASRVRHTGAVPYTKDECDLWSVGCTLFECATGRLPFIPFNGPTDVPGMYNMMMSRPADVVCGHCDETGKIIWGRELPRDRCTYPWSLRRLLYEFLRRLFDRRDSTRLTFTKFSQLCNELTSLRRFTFFNVNALSVEEYFDTSTAVHFDRLYFEQEAQQVLPPHNVACVLALPSGIAVSCLSTEFRKTLESSTDVVVMAFNKQGDLFSLPITVPRPATELVPMVDTLRQSLREARFAAANVLRLERDTDALWQFVEKIRNFARTFYASVDGLQASIVRDLETTGWVGNAVKLQSSLLAMDRPNDERNGIQNNANRCGDELVNNLKVVESLRMRMCEVNDSLGKVETIDLARSASMKDTLEVVLKNRTVDSGDCLPKNILLANTDCRLLFNTLKDAIGRHRDASSEVHHLLTEQIEPVLRHLFDLQRGLEKAKRAVNDTMGLVRASQESNQLRFETAKKNGSICSNTSNPQMTSALKCAQIDARQVMKKAEESLRKTKEVLRSFP